MHLLCCTRFLKSKRALELAVAAQKLIPYQAQAILISLGTFTREWNSTVLLRMYVRDMCQAWRTSHSMSQGLKGLCVSCHEYKPTMIRRISTPFTYKNLFKIYHVCWWEGCKSNKLTLNITHRVTAFQSRYPGTTKMYTRRIIILATGIFH